MLDVKNPRETNQSQENAKTESSTLQNVIFEVFLVGVPDRIFHFNVRN